MIIMIRDSVKPMSRPGSALRNFTCIAKVLCTFYLV